MSRYQVIDAIVRGIVTSDNATKQELGRRFAYSLGLAPGPLGVDGGIDGTGVVNGSRIYFQSKLKQQNLGALDADIFHSGLVRCPAQIGIMLAGVGYTSPTPSNPKAGFRNRLLQFPDIDEFTIHLLTLKDLFEENGNFQVAVKDLPPLQQLSRENWDSIR